VSTLESVGIVGTGIAGLGAAWNLRDTCEVTLFDGSTYAGGHSNTVTVQEPDRDVPIDTGFMVFNEVTYPLLTALFRELDVETMPTSMSFGVQHRATGIEYCGSSLGQLFAQRRNVFRPRFLRLLTGISRFNREAHEALASNTWDRETLESYALARGYGEDFLRLYLLPMAGAVWSTPFDRARDFPALTLLRFFRNHGLLGGLSGHHPWLTVRGGARTYVEKMTRPFRDRIQLGNPVTRIERHTGGVTLRLADGESRTFDRVVIACHADDALRLLAQPTEEETRLLRAFRYQKNVATLHTDASPMPANRRAWAAWTVRVDEKDADASTIYWMNELQNVSDRRNYFVSIDDPGLIRDESILETIVYHHPLFDRSAVELQPELPSLNAISSEQTTFYCGAWFGYGFHEDGYRSGLDAAAAVRSAIARRREAAA
jgi:predicted NAD/FAD-binding protein